MPLEKGKSAKVRKRNIKELMAAGHPLNQSIAISYRVAGEKKK